MGIKIKDIEYFLPERVITNREMEHEFPDWSAEKIEEKTGIQERHVVVNETSLDLAIQACEKLFLKHNKDQIDFVLFCTQSPDYFLPTTACILQNKLGLRRNIGALDFNLGCSGYVYGLALAKGLINTGIASTLLLVTAETYTKFIHKKDKGNRTIFGDGAAATIVEKTSAEHIKEFVLGTDGSGFQNLIVSNGALRNKYNALAPEINEEGNIRTENNLFMNGPEIFNFTIGAVPILVNEVLAKNGLTMEQIDYVIFHQANKYMLSYLRKKIKIPEEKFYMNMLKTGNTVSSTIPIALKDCTDEQRIKKGDKVLLVGFGVGYSWGATVVEW
ncbi:MAG TPA: ketoacyl-ACP synthase III [Cytophagaceae bacterium]|jgi:3-oxoacyl-[acyl-carrier-protein] synthase-3|nr:ketoacyl-ACP synthase III [Cytophagaceae bacterium]